MPTEPKLRQNLNIILKGQLRTRAWIDVTIGVKKRFYQVDVAFLIVSIGVYVEVRQKNEFALTNTRHHCSYRFNRLVNRV